MTADLAPSRGPATSWLAVERSRVLGQLSAAADARVVTLSATAGFGKSTILAQWSARWRDERAGDVVRLEVTEGADSRELADRLAAALSGEPTELSPALLPPAYDEPTWHAATLPALRSLLAADRAPLLIVIDDAMNLTDALAPSLLEAVLTTLPAGSQLAIGTRDVTPYPARRLRSSGRSSG